MGKLAAETSRSFVPGGSTGYYPLCGTAWLPRTQAKILSDNLPGANDAPTVLSKDLEEQITHNRVTKLDVIPEHFISSPLGLEPKPNGKWRRIHHLSHPRGRSVNCHIPIEYGSLESTSVDEAIATLLNIGKGAILQSRCLQT